MGEYTVRCNLLPLSCLHLKHDDVYEPVMEALRRQPGGIPSSIKDELESLRPGRIP